MSIRVIRGIFKLLKFQQIKRVNMKRINKVEYIIIYNLGMNGKAVGILGGEFILVKYLGTKPLTLLGNIFKAQTDLLTIEN